MEVATTHAVIARQTPLPPTEQNFASIHSRFKINFLLNDGSGLCYYGQEANASVADMMAGRVKEIILDARQGYTDCMEQAKRRRRQYATAIIYQKREGEWIPVSWYMQGDLFKGTAVFFEKPRCCCSVSMNEGLLSVRKLYTLAAA